MQITASAISLNVEDPVESASFAKQHLGFTEDMADDGFVSLSKQDAGFNLIYLRTGLESFKPDSMRGAGRLGASPCLGFTPIHEWSGSCLLGNSEGRGHEKR